MNNNISVSVELLLTTESLYLHNHHQSQPQSLGRTLEASSLLWASQVRKMFPEHIANILAHEKMFGIRKCFLDIKAGQLVEAEQATLNHRFSDSHQYAVSNQLLTDLLGKSFPDQCKSIIDYAAQHSGTILVDIY